MEFQLGSLNDYNKQSEFVSSSDPTDLYKFSLGQQQTVSMFLSGLSAGTKLELLDNNGTLIDSSVNSGTLWTANNSGTTGGLITKTLASGDYQVKVSYVDQITGNPLYDQGDKYSLIFQPHDAPNTVAVASSTTKNKGGADILTDGTNDQEEINKAIEQVGKAGGGTVLLLDGTFNISQNIMVVYDNVTITGVGWDTKLKQANNTAFKYAGMVRSAYGSGELNKNKPLFVNQHFRHMSWDGNKANQTTDKNAYGNFGTYQDSSFEDLRVFNFKHYGLDPHENSDAGQSTIRLTVKDNLADHNDVDGITIDDCQNSTITNNISDSNGRHGINIVTGSHFNTISNNVVTNNGYRGIVVQSGSDKTTTSDDNTLVSNTVKFNKVDGIYVELANRTKIQDNISQENGQAGIHLKGASNSTISENELLNNSQSKNKGYSELLVNHYLNTTTNQTTYSTNNVAENNTILNNKSVVAKYGIEEKAPGNDYNIYKDNTIQGTYKTSRIQGLNSKEIYSVNQTGRTIWDPAVGDPLAGVSQAPQYVKVDYKANDGAGNTKEAARDIGSLTDYQKFTDYVGQLDANDFYKFTLGKQETVSIFLNGLAGGTTIRLLNSDGSLVKSSTNKGTTWTESDSGNTDGLISQTLAAGTYFVNVKPGEMTGNPIYDNDEKYSVIFQPHDAANTVAVAAKDTGNKGGADFTATGSNDQVVINQAIAQVGKNGGGTVLLLPGTFNISDNVLLTYDNVTLSGVGWSTVLKQANNVEFDDAGMLRSALHSSEENLAVPRFYNQNIRHLKLDGNKSNQTSTKNAYGNFGTYGNSNFEDLRVTNFAYYGFDPHENAYAPIPTVALTIKDSLSDHNGQDGITIDNLEYSLVADNIADSNKRHGINVVTATQHTNFFNNVATYNGIGGSGNGITIQPGAIDLSRTSDYNLFEGNISKYNKTSGIYSYLGDNNQYKNNIVEYNGTYGIRLRSSSNNIVSGNKLLNNSQALKGGYAEIYIDDDDTTTFSTGNTVSGNTIVNNPIDQAKWGIGEKNVSNSGNTIAGNVIQGITKPYRVYSPISTV
ncbi:right-handed parallel beta-helix repeat-containing protein [Phormidium sp. LEGE 05292]|uniref:right-handed parallel beta-helix repeat-containing protein n=1 Tax=[Phormidium] sp. LEGE 05292 TaxID=767427 RepID=UPI001882409C|nr:right-handed parallel beta-helix repeat-containing protein [Phormidium sp. LEGE 05292]MBE9227385.1 right-handed parallel beta-helix repeat-containing protein [Phormidium sp. LEGE 05292]